VSYGKNILSTVLGSPRKKKKKKREFDAEGSGYDYDTAKREGMKPRDGHWGSVSQSGMILKGAGHKTFHKTVEAEKRRGNKIERRGKRYFSIGPASIRSSVHR